MTDFILVHGGVHGAWCWDEAAELLRALDHTVDAVDLPGRGEDKDVTLEQWVEHLGRAVDRRLAGGAPPPTLVAHSMGGVPVSQLAERRPDDIGSVVYVNAIVPADGVGGLTALGEAGPDCALLAEGAMVPTADGRAVVISPDVAPRAFYHRCAPEVAARATVRLCAEPVLPMSTPVVLGSGLHGVRTAWIAATDDRIVPMSLQEAMAARIGARLATLDADHSPFLSTPRAFVDLVVALA